MSSPVCSIPSAFQAWLDAKPDDLVLIFAGSLALSILWWILSHVRPSAIVSFLVETFFVSIPTIQLENVPLSVTQDDGVKSPPVAKQHPPLRDPQHPNSIQCYDPATLQWLGQVPAMTATDVQDICQKAAAAQQEWKRTTFAQRRQVLRTLQRYITAHVSDICRCSARDSGKPMVDAALGEVLTTCEKIRTIVSQGEGWLRPERRTTGPMFVHKTAQVEYEPLGVIGTIAPWNYPYVCFYLCIVAVVARRVDEIHALLLLLLLLMQMICSLTHSLSL